MKLINPTDDQIDAAVAEHVAGNPMRKVRREIWVEGGCFAAPTGEYEEVYEKEIARYSRSMDAVLPLLFDHAWTSRSMGMSGMPEGQSHPHFIVRVREIPHVNSDGSNNFDIWHEAFAHTLPRAGCIALLRAHGVEVEFTKESN